MGKPLITLGSTLWGNPLITLEERLYGEIIYYAGGKISMGKSIY